MFFLLVFCVKCCRRLYNIDFTTNDPKSTLAIKKSIPFRKNLRSYSILIIMNMWSKRVNLDFIWFCTKPSLLMYFSSSCIRVVPIGTFSRFGFQSHCHYCQMYDTWNFRPLLFLIAFAATVVVFERNQTRRNSSQNFALFGRHRQSTCLTLTPTDCQLFW